MTRTDLQNVLTPRRVNWLLLMGFALLILLDIKRFFVWDQIITENYNPVDIMLHHNPHILRITLMWPLMQLSDILGIDRSFLFSFLVLAQLWAMSWLQNRTLGIMVPTFSGNKQWASTQFLLAWMFVSFFMNGRLIMVFMGISLILFSQVHFLTYQRHKIYLILLQMAGLFLTSVSSGSFTVAFIYIAAFMVSLPFMHMRKNKKIRTDMILWAMLIVIFSSLPLKWGILHNLEFFNNSVGEMLLHGPFDLLHQANVSVNALLVIYFLFSALIIGMTIPLYFKLLWKGYTACPAILLVAFSLMLGAFGYSTLLTMLPALMLGSIYYINDFINNYRLLPLVERS